MVVTGLVGYPESYPVHNQIHRFVPIDYESSVIFVFILFLKETFLVVSIIHMFQSFNGFLYLFPIILFSILYNIPKFFEVEES